MNRQNQSTVFASLFARLSHLLLASPLAFVVLGGCLASVVNAVEPFASGMQVQPQPSSLIAQVVVDTLPPPPPTNSEQEQFSTASFTPREIEFEAPNASPPKANLESYLVYVDAASLPTLQQVRQLEPKAFVRQYNGHFVIQTGIFSKTANAQQQAKALQSRGIEARIVSLATGAETNFDKNSKSYFVVIPGRKEDLPAIEKRVKQLKLDSPVNISQKEQPRGLHVSVGPFAERSQAERLNRYIVGSGLKNARVYFGR